MTVYSGVSQIGLRRLFLRSLTVYDDAFAAIRFSIERTHEHGQLLI